MDPKDPTVMWDRPKLEELKKARTAAVEKGLETFEFEGHEIVVTYARYLIEYLDHRLKPSPQPHSSTF